MKTRIVVQFVCKAGSFQAIVEQIQGLQLSPQQIAQLSVDGPTLGDAYENFKSAALVLQRERKLFPSTAITFKYLVVQQTNKAAHSA